MSISNNYIPVKQSGNGATVDFSGNWNVIAASYIRVYWEDKTTGVQTLKTLDTHYTLDFDEDGFTVTFDASFIPSSDVWVVIGRVVALDQNVPFKTSQGFQGAVTENSLDKVTAMVQDMQDQINRAPKVPLGSTLVLTIDEEPVAGKALIGNDDGDGYVNGPDAADIEDAQENAEIAVEAAADAEAAQAAAEAAQEAAEAAAAGQKWRPTVKARTTAALPANTYANGTAGVGATLTANANGALAAQDGVTLSVSDRFLVMDEVSQLKNGVYTVTSLGSAGTPYILTRATDADTWDELVSQSVAVEQGTLWADVPFICTSNAGGTIGTTAVTWIVLPSPLADDVITFAKLNTDLVVTEADTISGNDNDTTIPTCAAVKDYVDDRLIILGTEVAAAGQTSIDFAIPSGAKEIKIMFDGFSTSSTSPPQIQIGDSGGIENTVYKGTSAIISGTPAAALFTAAFGIGVNTSNWAGTVIVQGLVTLALMNTSHKWVASGNVSRSDAASTYIVSGSKTLSAELTTVRITTANGTDTIDAGSINVSWKF